MDKNTFEQLKREMEEVIALPEADPTRQEVVNRISQSDADAQAYWLSLVNEDEQIRLTIKRIDIPQNLTQRLQAIPDNADTYTLPRFQILSRWAGLAAMIFIGITVYIVAQPQQVQATESLAGMAITHHNNQSDVLQFLTNDPREVEKNLSRGVSFPVGMPHMEHGFKLLGGGQCRLGDNTVVYTRWEKDNKRYTLYQFCKHLFNIEADMPKQNITPKSARHHKVELWSKNSHCAYALVEELNSPAQ